MLKFNCCDCPRDYLTVEEDKPEMDNSVHINVHDADYDESCSVALSEADTIKLAKELLRLAGVEFTLDMAEAQDG